MGLTEIVFISIGVAMDAFAVAVCKGLAIKKINIKKMFKLLSFYCKYFNSLI